MLSVFMHFDQNIIFVIVAAIIGISRLIARIRENAREQSQGQGKPQGKAVFPPSQRADAKSDEERVREFLEALGQPSTSIPPPRVQPRTDLPPRPIAPIQPPPMARPFSPVLIRGAAERLRKIIKGPAAGRVVSKSALPVQSNEPGAWMREEEKTEAAKSATARSIEAQTTSAASTTTTWKQMLRSPDAMRDAIVLREILGPPRAIRELELI